MAPGRDKQLANWRPTPGVFFPGRAQAQAEAPDARAGAALPGVGAGEGKTARMAARIVSWAVLAGS